MSTPITDVVPNKNMLSGMESLLTLSGDELVEVVRLMPDGSYKNYRTFASKLRVGKSAYEGAVLNGFVGTEVEWLATLVGESAYETAVRLGEFVGTETEWVQSMAALYTHDVATSGQALVAGVDGIGTWKQLTGADVGLDQADNTPDLEKPVSDPQKTEFARYLLRSRTTTEVMKVLLALPGIRYTDDMKDIIFDEGRVTPVAP
jgi:hypothetical protein